MRTIRCLAGAWSAAAVVAFSVPAPLTAQGPRTTAAGVYTDAQAARSRKAYMDAKTVRGSMPQEAPGSLGMPTYVDIASFILKSNASPAGSSELATDAETLQQIKVENR
jgi:hypothetical protein